MVNQIKVGDIAPDFTLPDVDMKPRNLKEFLGKKVVLAFFIGAFTSTCTKEVCEFRDSMSRLVDLKAQVIGIDLTAPFSSKIFSEKNRLPFPVLSDSTREVFEKYGLQFSPCDESSVAGEVAVTLLLNAQSLILTKRCCPLRVGFRKDIC